MIFPSALLPALLALPLAARSRAYRASAACLAGLAGVAVIRLAMAFAVGTVTPYAGAARWAWAVDSAAVCAGAVLRVMVAWVGVKNACANSKPEQQSAPLASHRIGGVERRSDVRHLPRTVAALRRLGGAFGVAAPVLIFGMGASALWATYSAIRGPGGAWAIGSRYLLLASAAGQLLAGAWWAVSKGSAPVDLGSISPGGNGAASIASAGRHRVTARWTGDPRQAHRQMLLHGIGAFVKSIAPREWTALIFATGGAWDCLGALAPGDMAARWWITRAGNWAGCVTICVVQVVALARMRRAKR